MDLLDIAIAKQLAGGGGGSGTDNYNDLSNLPKINDTTLSGNKTSANLGLQSEINSDSKLASDLVDDTDQDNKFVTTTEKNTWNGKQNAIDSDHKLSSSLVSFTDAEAAAIASGIDSSKVGQISTNQTNILYVLGKTGKNLVNPELFTEGGYISDTSDGAVIASQSSVYMDYLMISPNTEYFITSIGSPGSWGAWYDSNKNFISGINAYGTKTSPANAKYIRCTVSYNNLNPNYATTFMICTKADYDASPDYQPYRGLPNYDLTRGLAELNAHPFLTVPFNHNMIYRGQNLGATLTDAQHTALSSGNFTDLYLGDYWTKTVTIPAGTYTGGDGEEVTVPAQTNITLKAVIADFDTFYAGYASSYAAINTHHAAVIVTGFSNVVWNKTNSTAGGYVASLIHKWLVGSALPQIETWFGSAKVLSHQKLLTNAITGDAASEWAWSSQKISLLSENQMYGSKVWGNSTAANGGYEPGEAFKHLNVFNHIDANLLFGNKNIWLRDIASAEWAAYLYNRGNASNTVASSTWMAPAALILLS